jgi:dienelactone hydrolase
VASLKRPLLVTILGLCAGSALTVAYLLRDPLPRFLERRSAIDRVRERPVDLAFRRRTSDGARRLPLVVILGGHVTGAEAVRLVGETPGVVAAAISYPFTGDPRPSTATFLREIPKIRRAFLDTPPALMLALDYLVTRREVDTSRLEGVGVSLGAPFMTIAGALDSRFTRVWAIHGSGGSYAPLEANMRRTIPFAPLRAIAATVANVIIAGPRLAPEKWVSRVAPRPFIMVNASDDERLPRSAVDALYRAAHDPKEMIWMSGAHIHGDVPTIRRLVAIVLARAVEPRGQ